VARRVPGNRTAAHTGLGGEEHLGWARLDHLCGAHLRVSLRLGYARPLSMKRRGVLLASSVLPLRRVI